MLGGANYGDFVADAQAGVAIRDDIVVIAMNGDDQRICWKPKIAQGNAVQVWVTDVYFAHLVFGFKIHEEGRGIRFAGKLIQ